MSQQGRNATPGRNENNELSLSGPAFVELAQSVLKKELPFRFRATGFSMYPFIRDGDIITISPLRNEALRFGDVVAFVHPKLGNLIIHRIFGRRKNSFHIKGDNVPFSNGFVPRKSIIGRITKVEREGKVVSFGFGIERFLIAFLTRGGCVSAFFASTWRLIRPFVRWYRFGRK